MTKLLNHKYKKTNDRGVEVEEENEAEMLIHTITLHFLGNPIEEQATSKTILINLRCPTLTDYRWYKDVFLIYVLKREDGTEDVWKEIFIVGLPKLFGERILSKLRQNFGTNDIPFDLLTFGQLFSIIKSEGLNLYNEINIQSKYGSEKAQSRKEMGTFCKAFGITKIEAPSTTRKRLQKRRPKPNFRRPIPKQPKPFVKKDHPKHVPKKKQTSKKKKPVVCYKCGKVGHKAFQCKTEQKINELFSDDPELQKKLLALLTTNVSEFNQDEDYYAESSEDSELSLIHI